MRAMPAMARATLPLIGAVLLLAACASGKPKPQPLEPLTPKIAGRAVWNQSLANIKFPLTVVALRDSFIVADGDGAVLALDAQSGRELWRGSADAKLSAGVGSDGRFAAVVTREGDLVVFEQGRIKWRKSVGVRVNTAPLVAGERVFVLGADRGVQAFDVIDGRKLWVLQRAGDPLTLTQTGVLAAFKDTLVVGQGPRMAGVDPLLGTLRWEVPVGSPRGANEIERLADLVGPVARVGNTLCARSFQAAVGCVDADKGTLVWSKNIGGIDGVSADAQFVFGADASDRITAWKTATGEVAWSSDKLQYRGLSTPLSVGKTVVFGDEDGTVHWLSRETGEAQLRLSTDGGAIIAAPVISSTTMLVVTRKGGLFAFRPE
jgi:outer membrane protein assembly factor BamB